MELAHLTLALGGGKGVPTLTCVLPSSPPSHRRRDCVSDTDVAVPRSPGSRAPERAGHNRRHACTCRWRRT